MEMYLFHDTEHTYPYSFLILKGYYETKPFRWLTDREVEAEMFGDVELGFRFERQASKERMNDYEARKEYLPHLSRIRKSSRHIDIQEVKSRHSIVDLVERYGVRLRKIGGRYVGNCPFHDDKNSSMYLYPEQNRWWCYADCFGGDVFDWIQKAHGVSFGQALLYLNDL